MNIPIRNLYHILCYAWDFVQGYEAVSREAENWSGIPELFAQVLIRLTTTLIRRGLYRSYLSHAEPVRGIRGKVNISATVAQGLLPQQLLHCEYDELSHDITSNQIIKATFFDLLRCQELDSSLRKQCEAIYRRLSHISRVSLHGALFQTIQVHRNNRLNRFLLDVCRLVFESRIASEERGTVQFIDFRKDEVIMRIIFESFIRNFYRYHAIDYKVTHPQLSWAGASGADYSMECLPIMQTDLMISKKKRCMIIEAKFTDRMMAERFGKYKLRSLHLYQIYAYLKNASYRKGLEINFEGMLLYPAVSAPVLLDYELPGAKLHVRSINLNQDWKLIHQDLLAFIA